MISMPRLEPGRFAIRVTPTEARKALNAKDLSFVLEVINGDWAILALSLMAVCIAYLWHERRYFTPRHENWPQGMKVAAAIATLSAGIFITRALIYVWRASYGAGDFSRMQLATLIAGAAIGAVGFLCAIREISRPLFGPVPWIATMVVLFLATIAMVGFHLF